jgi:MFS family permease
MSAVVLGLVEAGSRGWSAPITVASLIGGAVLLATFVRIEATAPEPILPLRILADRTRGSANAARGLGYAGMYGMVFFLTKYLQDIQHHSALMTGLGFLPTPISVFAFSQLTSRVLMDRVPPKALMLSGLGLSASGLLLLTQLSPSTPYLQVLPSFVLIGAGMGFSFVSLTTAGLHGVDPADAGAASGVINVSQQVGAALGLAVLVTIYDSVTTAGRSGLSHASAHSAGVAHSAALTLTHGLDITFGIAALFGAAALAVVAAFVRTPRPAYDEVAEGQLAAELAA